MSDPQPFLLARGVCHTYPDGVAPLSNISWSCRRVVHCLVGPSAWQIDAAAHPRRLLVPTEGEVLLKGTRRTTPSRWASSSNTTTYAPAPPPKTCACRWSYRASAMGSELPRAAACGPRASRTAIRRSFGGWPSASLWRGRRPRPELLLLDEPFGALDALTRERCARAAARWNALPVTVFMVTHSIREAVLRTGCWS